MNRKTLLVASSISMFLLAAGCSNNTQTPDTQSSTSQSSAENQDNNSSVVKQSITSDNNSIWDEKTHREAEKFAEEIVETVGTKDMKALSEMIEYPISINVDGKLTTISNKEDFAALKFKSVFDDEMIETLGSAKTLFSNWRGFMLGEGNHNIWFSPMNISDSEFRIISIVDGDFNEEIRVVSNHDTTNWSSDTHDKAELFATEVIGYIEKEDMKSIGEHISYPIGIKVKNQLKTINSTEEFDKLKFEDVFDVTLKRDICNSRSLFNNSRGFMLGDEDNNIWFAPKKNDVTTMEILSINNSATPESDE